MKTAQAERPAGPAAGHHSPGVMAPGPPWAEHCRLTADTGNDHGDRKVGEPRIRIQPGKFVIGGEGLCVGRDSGEAVTDDYPGTLPWRFTGDTIRRVAVDVSGKPYVDMA